MITIRTSRIVSRNVTLQPSNQICMIVVLLADWAAGLETGVLPVNGPNWA